VDSLPAFSGGVTRRVYNGCGKTGLERAEIRFLIV